MEHSPEVWHIPPGIPCICPSKQSYIFVAKSPPIPEQTKNRHNLLIQMASNIWPATSPYFTHQDLFLITSQSAVYGFTGQLASLELHSTC